MPVQVVASEAHRDHETMEFARGRVAPSPESPTRATIISDALHVAGHRFVEPDDLDLDLVHRVHSAEYVEFLRTAWERWIAHLGPDAAESGAVAFTWPRRGELSRRPDDVVGQLGYHSFAGDSPIVAGTWAAVTASAAIAQTAADLVVGARATAGSGVPSPVYALCRPPGHHATADQLGGYCYLNNSAIAAQRLLDRGSRRVAVLDVDYHHGNGTQAIFDTRDDVLTVSIHADPASEFPWFTGHADEIGSGAGAGWNLNLPLPRHAERAVWDDALDTALSRITDAASTIDALVVALGVDTYVDDPLGTFPLDTDDFSGIGRRVAGCGLPTVVVQEGGYAVDALGRNVAAVLDGMASTGIRTGDDAPR